jgi:hypothetical protein
MIIVQGKILHARRPLVHLDSMYRYDPTSIGTRRARPICFSSLPVPQGVSSDLRDGREVREANRAVRHLELPGRREHGFQGRLSTRSTSCGSEIDPERFQISAGKHAQRALRAATAPRGFGVAGGLGGVGE